MMKVILSILLLGYLVCLSNGDEEISDPTPKSPLCIKFGESGGSGDDGAGCQSGCTFTWNENNNRYQYKDIYNDYYYFTKPAQYGKSVFVDGNFAGTITKVGC